MHRLPLVAIALFIAVGLAPNAAPGETTPKKIVYKSTPQGDLSLHLFQPPGDAPEEGRTVVVFFFGGGWVGGSPHQFYPFAEHLAARDIVAIPAEYRVKNVHQSTVVQSVSDAMSAIRYVRAHAAELGVNPDRIISAGGSAGGHLAASTGTLTGFDETGEDTSVSSRPNAMILFNPVVDTTPSGYTGQMLPKEGDKDLSPVHHIEGGTPPTIIFHGTADTAVPHENAERFRDAMKAAGNRCTLQSFEGEKHGFFNHRPDTLDNYRAVVAAMDAFIDSLAW